MIWWLTCLMKHNWVVSNLFIIIEEQLLKKQILLSTNDEEELASRSTYYFRTKFYGRMRSHQHIQRYYIRIKTLMVLMSTVLPDIALLIALQNKKFLMEVTDIITFLAMIQHHQFKFQLTKKFFSFVSNFPICCFFMYLVDFF